VAIGWRGRVARKPNRSLSPAGSPRTGGGGDDGLAATGFGVSELGKGEGGDKIRRRVKYLLGWGLGMVGSPWELDLLRGRAQRTESKEGRQ